MSATATKEKYFYGVGRRKTSTAKAKYYLGSKEVQVTVNGKKVQEYFPDYYYQTLTVMLHNAGLTTGEVEIFVRGGGQSSQAEAVRLAIAKAMVAQDEGFRPVLRMFNYLTTDNRKVLPKRPGLRKARKREQWSKR
jgi:small subunit ribosomal protein S9